MITGPFTIFTASDPLTSGWKKNSQQLVGASLRLYENTRLQGAWKRALSGLLHKPSGLLDLQAAKDRACIAGQRYAGIEQVDIKQIQGSEGRAQDFDQNFTPLNEKTRIRWMSIAAQRLSGGPVPPVELIKIGETYFVRDGHHRISVSKAFGEYFIEAEVTVLNLCANNAN